MDSDLTKLVVWGLLALAIWLIFFRETEEKKEQKRLEERRRLEREAEQRQRLEQERIERQHRKAVAAKEFKDLVSARPPRSVDKAHRVFKSENPLANGQRWYGEEVSPLTFYGYRVGKARGLRQNERRDIVRYVMRAQLAAPLADTYRAKWGRPFTLQRRDAIVGHVRKLAAQRSARRGYEAAVAEWLADGEWASTIMDEEISKFDQYQFQ